VTVKTVTFQINSFELTIIKETYNINNNDFHKKVLSSVAV